MPGLTTDGFQRATMEDLVDETTSELRGAISAQLDLSESTVIGNINTILCDKLAQAWEVLEEAVAGLDPEIATEARLVSLALLTGVKRRPPQKGLVTCTIALDAAQSYGPGDLVAHVLDDPDNLWSNRDAVVSTSAGNYSAVFHSNETGPEAVAAAGTLTVQAPAVAGWTAITNAADATPGTDEEDIETLRLRREASLALAGSGTVDAIRADVLEVGGVLQARVNENTTDGVVGGLAAHSFQVVVWDGDPGAADDDELAQAIQDTRPAGIAMNGAVTGTAVKADGEPVTIQFDRVTPVPIYIDVDIQSASGVAIADVKAAVAAAMPTQIGGDVIFNKIAAAVFNVDGVDDWDFVQIGTAPSPSGTVDIAISATQIATLDLSDVVVTGDAS